MTLLIYFSKKDENYCQGEIRSLEVGQTAKAAAVMAEALKIEALELQPETPYPKGYRETVQMAKKEKEGEARPAYKPLEADVSAHQKIIIGFPIWMGTFPMIVASFLTDHDFSGKDIYPFCTNEGSGLGNSMADLAQLCPTANIHQGLSLRGSKADTECSGKGIRNWLSQSSIA